MYRLKILILVAFSATFSFQSIAQKKIPIRKADDLPRRSVTLRGKAVEIVEDAAQLDSLNDLLITRLEADLETYDIQDKATLQAYYLTLAASYAYKLELERAQALIAEVKELEDKESEKLTTGLYLTAFAEAYRQFPDVDSDGFRDYFEQRYRQQWQALPYEKVADEVEAMRGSLSIFNPELITSGLESQLQPYLDNNGNVVPEGVITNFIGIRLSLDYRAKLVPIMLQVLNELYENNQQNTQLTDIWAERDAGLSPGTAGKPVVVAVWDSGTDLHVFPQEQIHQDRQGRSGIGYSLIDYRKDDLLLEDPAGKITSGLDRLQRLTKGFMDLQAGVTSPEADSLRQTIAGLKANEVQAFQEELSFYGNYAHGTHVAGIALKDNPFARLLVVRMGFDYRMMPPAHTMEHARFQAEMYREIVDYLRANQVAVVNMSWRYGVGAYEALLSLNGVGKDEEERRQLAREMFELEKQALYEAIRSAPEILFICGSGNENNDAGFVEYIPASFEGLPNLLTVGAVNHAGKKTSFTTEGESVRFYANGFEVESYVPGGTRVKFSGTSMAAPHVANLAAKILALRPELSPQEVIEQIERGADSLPENPDLRLIHPKKTLALLKGEDRDTGAANELLIRKWSPDRNTALLMVEDYLTEVAKQSPEQARAMEAQKEMLVSVFEQVTIEYKADGTVAVAVPNSPVQTGTWVLDKAEGKLMVEVAGQSDYEIIREVSAAELTTTTAEGHTYRYVAL